jgi:hypothetical protein
MRSLLVVLMALAACGGDDSGSGSTVTCKISLTGAVTITDDVCKVFLCTTPDYQDLAITQAGQDSSTHYQMIPSLDLPAMFTARSYTIGDFRTAADFHVTTGDGKQYVARATTDRTSEETAMVTLSKVIPANATDNCSGAAVGTMAISMVEISFGTGGATVGPGRIQASVTVTE